MSAKISCFLMFSFVFVSINFADTPVAGGNVSGIWTVAGSPYLIQGNITIPVDSTLTIQPGVKVNFESNYTLTVNGFLQAIGTATDSIHFTASTDWGGITFANAPDSSHLSYCTVSKCNAALTAVYCNNSNLVITHCTIENNWATFYGAIFLDYSNSRITHCTIKDNGSAIYGSGINMVNSTPEISYCDIIGNGHVNSSGGGIFCAVSTAYISNCNIIGNVAYRGGGIFVDTGGSLIISNSSISNNTAYQGAGIAFLDGSSGTITNCVINADSTTNDNTAKGAGILISSSAGDFTISNSTISNCFTDCAVSPGGSGIHIDDADSVLITSSTFDNNFCTWQEGAIYSANCANLVIDHCNFVKNKCTLFAGGITLNGSTNLTLTNSIFRNQVESDILFANYSSASVSYCDFYGASLIPFNLPPPGLGTLVQTNDKGDSCDVFYNTYIDPLFVDFPNGNYHLTENSPCIDAGDPASPYDPDGTITDMGRYFFDQGGTGIPGGYVSGTWKAAGSPYRILGDITVHADSTLTINPGVDVIFQGLYTFQVNGALVAVGTEMDSISFSAADTSVGWRGIRLDAAADASLISYATIRYGRNTDGGGIYCASPDAVITHCAITDNKATNNGGGICINTGLHGPGLTNPPSVFNKCVISRNSARFGGGVFYMADSMIISECVISHNSATHSTGKANGGGIYFDGGFATSINIYNCIVQNNFCESDSLDNTTPYYGLGGGLYIEGRNGGGIFISNCQILSNWSRRSGGGIFILMSQGGVVISGCTLRGNFTRPCAIYTGQYLVGGGGISFSALSNNSIISRCEISENFNLGYAPTGGGAIRAFYNVNASLTLENCTISRNSSLQGWGAIHFNNTLILKNSVVAFNKSGNQKGSILASSAAFSFCDFFSNDGDPDRVLTSVNVNGDSCDAYANISLDPLFTDTTNSNYLITWANWPVSDSTRSPAIDAGDPESPSDFDETSADMGTYYFNQKRPLIEASDELLDFGEVFIGTQSDTSLLLYNHGFDTLEIYSIISPGDVFSTNFKSANSIILPEDSMEIIVSFSPADEGLILDTLFIESNDKPSQVFLQGTGKISAGIEENLSAIPKEYALNHAYPNPFNPSTHIKFALPKPGHVLIEVYNILGQKIDMLVNKEMTAGYHEIVFDAKNHPSAMYFYRIQAGEYQDVKKMLLIK